MITLALWFLPEGEVTIGADAIEALQINDVIFDVAVNPDRGYGVEYSRNRT
jgi:hypothetical protein